MTPPITALSRRGTAAASHQRGTAAASHQRGPAAASRQRGVSLVSLMVASVIALFVATAAVQFFVGQVQAARRLTIDARLQQDLRAATELLARDLRRAGYGQAVAAADATGPAPNPYSRIELVTPQQLSYSHSRDRIDDGVVSRAEASGFRLADGSLQMLVGGSWQALNDPSIVTVTQLRIRPDVRTVSLGHLCAPACTLTDDACPRLLQRRFHIELAGRSASDPQIARQLQTTVPVRNDLIDSPRCPGVAA